MDGLGDKLKNLFSFGKDKEPAKDPKFKGQGHRLGSGGGQPASEAKRRQAAAEQPQRPAAGAASSAGPTASSSSSTGAAADARGATNPLPRVHTAAPPAAATPARPPAHPAPPPQPGINGAGRGSLGHSSSKEDVVLDRVLVANTPTAKEAHLLAATQQQQQPVAPGQTQAMLRHKLGNVQTDTPMSPTTSTPVAPQAIATASPTPAGGGAAHARSRLAFQEPISVVSSISTPTAGERQLGHSFLVPEPPSEGMESDYGVARVSDNGYALQHALGLVLSCSGGGGDGGGSDGAAAGAADAGRVSGDGRGAAGRAGPHEACGALLTVLRNVLTKPHEPKFRKIRLSNPKIMATITSVPGAVEFLEAAGFELRFMAAAAAAGGTAPSVGSGGGGAEEERMLADTMTAHGFATDGPPATATAAPFSPSPAGANPAAPAHSAPGVAAGPPQRERPPQRDVNAAPAVPRATQVILPATPDTAVPEWFFQRTGAEIKAQWQAMLRKRAADSELMTTAMRARLAGPAPAGVGPNTATVRVRFPEGVCLQGNFGAAEPVSRVFEWVSGALRSPTRTYELVKPDRKALVAVVQGAGGVVKPLTVAAADLLPSVILNLRPLGDEAGAPPANLPLLNDAMLAATTLGH